MSNAASAHTAIRYFVSAPNPSDHLFHVRMELDLSTAMEELELVMPVWTPGSYLVREYGRHVQNVRASDGRGGPRKQRKIGKASWAVDVSALTRLVVTYEVFAHDLTVRTNHLDDSHGFFNGTALFLYPPALMDADLTLRIDPPRGWEVYCGFEGAAGEGYQFEVSDFDVLFDTPVEMGADHDVIDFEALGVPHRIVVWGRGRYDREAWVRDYPRVIEANAAMFDGKLPYSSYLVILHLCDTGYGGLEHLNSTVLLYPRHKLEARGSVKPGESDDAYADYLRLVCHEHFHVWNVKRIRPAVLGPFDYQNENYTRELWSIEGVTSYYDTLNLLRAGIIDARDYLKRLAQRIKMLEAVPGRHVQSLEDSSFDAWIKLYRPDENTSNSSVSYYLKGELMSCLLDLWMRGTTRGAKGLDAVMAHLWQAFCENPRQGYAEGAYEEIVESITGSSPTRFFERYIRGMEDPDWNEFLTPLGLKLVREYEKGSAGPWLGLVTRGAGSEPATVSFVPSQSPAHLAGIFAGDELVAFDGFKVSSSNLGELVELYRPEDEIDVHLFRRSELLKRRVTLGSTPPDKYEISLRDDASSAQRELMKGWLGADAFSE